MVNIFFGFWRKSSWVFVIVTLFYCYINLPESVAVTYNEAGRPVRFMDKQNFFYLAIGLLLGVNLLLGILKNQFQKLDLSNSGIKNPWFTKKENLSTLVSGWSDAFLAIINTFIVFVLFALRSINGDAQQSLDRNYGWMIVLGAVLLLILVFFLPLRILFTKPDSAD